jgi:hypothetical protein
VILRRSQASGRFLILMEIISRLVIVKFKRLSGEASMVTVGFKVSYTVLVNLVRMGHKEVQITL